MMRCPQCHTQLVSGASFCPACGAPAQALDSAASQDQRIIRIGRDEDCDFKLSSPAVSKHHAALIFYKGSWYLRDTDSTNGTYLNGSADKITTAPVTEKDVALFGDETVAIKDIIASQDKTEKFRIGRATDNDIILSDPSVSRYHAFLVVDDGKVILQDCGSSNGTFVNGHKIEKAVIIPQDAIRLGNVNFVPPCKEFSPLPEQPEAKQPSSKILPFFKSAYFLLIVLTVVCISLLFAFYRLETASLLIYKDIIGFYICIVSGILVYKLSGSKKSPIPVITVASVIFFLLNTSFWRVFNIPFISLLDVIREGVTSPVEINYISNVIFALSEEAFKILPLLFCLAIYRMAKPRPWAEYWGISNGNDGILFGVAAAIGFTLNETLFGYFALAASAPVADIPHILRFLNPALTNQYIAANMDLIHEFVKSLANPDVAMDNFNFIFYQTFYVNPFAVREFLINQQQTGILMGILLVIPRTLSVLVLHGSFSGCLGYFLGKYGNFPHIHLTPIISAYLAVAAAHACWNSFAAHLLFQICAGIISLSALVFFIIKSRQEEGNPLSIYS